MQKEMLLLMMKRAEGKASRTQCWVLSQLYFSFQKEWKKNADDWPIPGLWDTAHNIFIKHKLINILNSCISLWERKNTQRGKFSVLNMRWWDCICCFVTGISISCSVLYCHFSGSTPKAEETQHFVVQGTILRETPSTGEPCYIWKTSRNVSVSPYFLQLFWKYEYLEKNKQTWISLSYAETFLLSRKCKNRNLTQENVFKILEGLLWTSSTPVENGQVCSLFWISEFDFLFLLFFKDFCQLKQLKLNKSLQEALLNFGKFSKLAIVLLFLWDLQPCKLPLPGSHIFPQLTTCSLMTFYSVCCRVLG